MRGVSCWVHLLFPWSKSEVFWKGNVNEGKKEKRGVNREQGGGGCGG